MTDDENTPPDVPDWVRDVMGEKSPSEPPPAVTPPVAESPPASVAPPAVVPQFPPPQGPPLGAQPAYPTQPNRPAQPYQPGQPGQPVQPVQPPYVGQQFPAAQRPYAGQPPYGGQPPYAGQPPYYGQTQHPGQPPYGAQPPFTQHPQQAAPANYRPQLNQQQPIIYQPGIQNAPSRKRSGAGAVIAAVAFVVVVVLIIGGVAIRGVFDFASTLAEPFEDDPFAVSTPTSAPVNPAPSATPEPEPTEPPEDVVVEPPPPVTPVDDLDSGDRFRAGEFAVTLPKISKKAKKTAFTKSEYSATEWLYKERDNAPKGIKVVFTADPKFNCALEYGYSSTSDRGGVAGCYSAKYYKTLFMWWGPDATDYTKKFVLLHEYSHFIQWWDYYDTMQSGWTAGIFDKASTRQAIIESDATCRVVHQWKWKEVETSAPCDAKNWDKWWLNKKVKAKGVTITDW